jgi:hypothetical protein
MKTLQFVFVFLVAIVAMSCNNTSVIAPTNSVASDLEIAIGVSAENVYAYVGYDSTGRVRDRGWLSIIVRDPARVTGEWQFNNGRRQPLIGTLRGNVLSCNLNPTMVDNNLLLNGTLDRTSYRGEWSYVGFPGVMARGRFIAQRRVVAVAELEAQ